MRTAAIALAGFVFAISPAGTAIAGEHPGRSQIEKEGYKGPATCEECHAEETERYQKASQAIDELAGIFSVLLPARPISMNIGEPVSAAAPGSPMVARTKTGTM